MGWQVLERYESEDGRIVVRMLADPEGHYRYVLSSWMDAHPEDEGVFGEGFWMDEEISGLYGWQDPCREDAKRALKLRSG